MRADGRPTLDELRARVGAVVRDRDETWREIQRALAQARALRVQVRRTLDAWHAANAHPRGPR
jgi:hypothetical protein